MADINPITCRRRSGRELPREQGRPHRHRQGQRRGRRGHDLPERPADREFGGPNGCDQGDQLLGRRHPGPPAVARPTGGATVLVSPTRHTDGRNSHARRHLAGQAERLGRGGARPTIEQPTDAIIKITSTNICGSDLHLYETSAADGPRRRPRPRADGHRRGGRQRGRRPQGRRPGRHPVPDLLRALLDVHPRALHPVRDHPGPRPGQRRRALRLLQALRAGPGRAGGVPARAAGAVHPHQGPRGPLGRPLSSTSPTCCRPRGRP